MTDKQIAASRANGRRSKGPVTAQGKRNSSYNAIRHGLLTETIVLQEESVERFHDLLNSYLDEFKPATSSQLTLVETMAACRWRLLRIWAAQKIALDREMADQDPNQSAASRLLAPSEARKTPVR